MTTPALLPVKYLVLTEWTFPLPISTLSFVPTSTGIATITPGPLVGRRHPLSLGHHIISPRLIGSHCTVHILPYQRMGHDTHHSTPLQRPLTLLVPRGHPDG